MPPLLMRILQAFSPRLVSLLASHSTQREAKLCVYVRVRAPIRGGPKHKRTCNKIHLAVITTRARMVGDECCWSSPRICPKLLRPARLVIYKAVI